MQKIISTGFEKDRIPWYGNKFLNGNGYFGVRGTMEEYTKENMPAINMAGIYDRVGNAWRESINAPNVLYTYIKADGCVYALPIPSRMNIRIPWTITTACKAAKPFGKPTKVL